MTLQTFAISQVSNSYILLAEDDHEAQQTADNDTQQVQNSEQPVTTMNKSTPSLQ